MDPQAELDQINAALSRILQGGQSYSLSSGGSSRSTTYASYEALIKRKRELETRIAASQGALGGRIGAAW
jgi:hypothetical protein